MTPAPTDTALRELDAEIARLRGWRHDPTSPRGLGIRWRPAATLPEYEWNAARYALADRDGTLQELDDAPPPFSSEWALAGPLADELAAAAELQVTIETCDSGWECCVEHPESGAFWIGTGETAPEAIARAYLAWRRSQPAT